MIWAVAENIISWLRNFRLSAGAGRRGVEEQRRSGIFCALLLCIIYSWLSYEALLDLVELSQEGQIALGLLPVVVPHFPFFSSIRIIGFFSLIPELATSKVSMLSGILDNGQP